MTLTYYDHTPRGTRLPVFWESGGAGWSTMGCSACGLEGRTEALLPESANGSCWVLSSWLLDGCSQTSPW